MRIKYNGKEFLTFFEFWQNFSKNESEQVLREAQAIIGASEPYAVKGRFFGSNQGTGTPVKEAD